ncbi:hypothetical protein A4R28_21990 [Mesorhizobium ciceri]|nr:hypothetical protein A4R28_21990 [Mesorhizobium ciceri]
MCEPFEAQIKACSRKSSCSRQQVLRRLTRIVALQGKEPEWCTACEGRRMEMAGLIILHEG